MTITRMQAVITTNNPAQPLIEASVPTTPLGANDILVKVAAISINPVDQKQRLIATQNNATKILGFDGVGEVIEIGSAVTKFKVHDRVYYAGELGRNGSYAEYQVVREDLVAIAPANLDDAEAAAIPLTFLTAYELLFDQFGFKPEAQSQRGQTILIINGAGGVGSAMIQLSQWLGMDVIATASRPETTAWVTKLGAHHVVNHRHDYVSELKQLGYPSIPYIAILSATNEHFAKAAELIAPFGHIGMIVEPTAPLAIGDPLKAKAASLHWEFMFAKALNNYNVASQGDALAFATDLIENKHFNTTLTETIEGFSASNIYAAQEKAGSGKIIGKLAIKY
ncbi:zinc-binding alcohol dehydrogenase family protein [Weissella soli]|uniref:zinc-binding alcohol dehydrogenase family protein n=1 Tax=Weissella soli TaxID=155866 RepID=UPI0011BBE5CF|nr:zinc-binding alcohol dehydrogenase family protein [Weissella soli]QEA35738.1 zinc-binding alcohol dehydrogenase family protein [Weissella soli]